MKNHAEPHWGRVTARDWPKPPQDIMKQLPVLEPGDKPRKQTWYTLTPVGDSLCAQVGHRCSYLPPVGDAERGKVFIVGRADPNRSFSDVHTIDLGTHQWDLATSEGLLPRYEHTSFIPSCTPHSIWVFGGADQSGNPNCLQVLNPDTRTWTTPEVTGPPPSARTFHTSSAAIGDQLYIFPGGERDAQPMQDVQLHVFDAKHPELVTTKDIGKTSIPTTWSRDGGSRDKALHPWRLGRGHL